MRKATFQYRLYPTKAQETALQHILNECRWLYKSISDNASLNILRLGRESVGAMP
jgi:hypothetical protein